MAFVLYASPRLLFLSSPCTDSVLAAAASGQLPESVLQPSRTSPNPNAQLPPEHPDFEPEERGVRKLSSACARPLGAAAAPKRAGTKTKTGRRVAQAAGTACGCGVSASRKARATRRRTSARDAGEGES
ncbi:hypothetical protein B0H14DRAFT_2760421, partial [Mycena olivaceomarginata]